VYLDVFLGRWVMVKGCTLIIIRGWGTLAASTLQVESKIHLMMK